MYEPFRVLDHIDQHTAPILALCALAMVFNYSWFYVAFRQAQRDRAFSIPLLMTFFWLAHDASMIFRFDEMFNTYDHWYTKLFWVALVFTVLFEIGFLVQAIRYGRDELLPSWSQRSFALLMCGGAATAFAVWAFMKHVIVDPLYISSFDLATVLGPFCFIGLLVSRRSRAGQSPAVAWLYLAMAVCWFVAQISWFGPDFRDPAYYAVAATCILGTIGWIAAVSRAPAPAGAAAAHRPAVPRPVAEHAPVPAAR